MDKQKNEDILYSFSLKPNTTQHTTKGIMSKDKLFDNNNNMELNKDLGQFYDSKLHNM